MSELPALLVVEDNPAFRGALVSLLSPYFRVDAVALARTALARARETSAVAALVDLGLPDGDGVEVVRALRALHPELPIIVLTIEDGRDRVVNALAAGASGYVTKDRIASELLDALASVRSGGTPLSARVASHVVAELRDRHTTESRPPLLLTESERRVLEQLARGLTYDQIGLVLDITINTVRSRVRTLYDKLDVASRTEAIVAAANLGLIRLDP